MAIINITKENFQSVIGAGQPALIEFYAPWCSYCRRIAPAFEKVAEQYADSMAFGQINIDVSPELEDAYKVELVPTLMVFENGKPVRNIVAPGSKAQLDELIRPSL